MKAEREEHFEPVHLILETQEEVDKMTALFNFSPAIDSVELPDAWRVINKYGGAYSLYFEKLRAGWNGR